MPEFDRRWQDIGMNEAELSDLEYYICQNPEIAPIIEGTGRLRKLRWKLKNRGKSGSIRVLYIDFAYYEKVYLITVYPKDEKDNLTKAEKMK